MTAVEINQKRLQADPVIEIGKFTILWNILRKKNAKIIALIVN